MEKLIQIRCENNSSELFIKPGTTLSEVADILHLPNPHPFIAAYVNNKSKDLNYIIYEPKTIRFIDATHFEGARVYHRTLSFILYKAAKDLMPDSTLNIQHSIGWGFFFVISGTKPTLEIAASIKERMSSLVNAALPITRDIHHTEEAQALYSKSEDKLKIINTRRHLYVTVNQLADAYGYFYGTLAPSTSHTPVFDIRPFYDGFLLCVPKRSNPNIIGDTWRMDKFFDVFKLHKEWIDVLDVSNIGSLNTMLIDGKGSEVIKIGEALQERLFTHLTDTLLAQHREGVKLILISGPSSSGKTTFSNRINIQLRVFGLQPIVLSMDNYFVDREKTPLDERGEHDFESIDALDLKLFNSHLNSLLQGEEVEIPKFNFMTGQRFFDGTKLKLNNKSILIVEGIHALNPQLTASINNNTKYKIYVSALTSISMDKLSRFSTTDNRLLRRIVRDSKYRNHTALQTIRRWGSVRRGEEKSIFPYQEEADYMFNTALFFEISILKQFAEPLLLDVPDTEPEYSEARRLLMMLDFFLPLNHTEVPPTSVLREFIGGSSFKY